jgi:lipopolysaccharide transport system permease protein
VIRPLLSVLIYSAVFGRLAKMPSEGLPYPVFVFAAMLPWSYFATSLGAGTQSLAGNANLISKVYFPRLAIPLSTTIAALVDVAISLVALLVMMGAYGKVPPASATLALPLLFLLVAVISLGCSLWLGALNVKYRDVGNAVPFLIQIGMYATPVVYPLSLVPERYRALVALNPLTGVVEGFRAALFGNPWPVWPLLMAVSIGAILLVSGLYFFRSSERSFADTV